MKKFMVRLSQYDVDANITEVDIERETDKFVWIDGRRIAKRSGWENYFDSWDDAKKELLSCQESRCASLNEQLSKANFKLNQIIEMKC